MSIISKTSIVKHFREHIIAKTSIVKHFQETQHNKHHQTINPSN